MKKLTLMMLLIIFISFNMVDMHAMELSEEALSQREQLNEEDEYSIESSLSEEYGVEDIFSDKESNLNSNYTVDDLFLEDSTVSTTISKESYSSLFTEDVSYHHQYQGEKEVNRLYKIIVIILIIAISYILTTLYLTIKRRRRYAKNTSRASKL